MEEIRPPAALAVRGWRGIWYRFGAAELHVRLVVTDDDATLSTRHPAFRVDGVDPFRERLEAAGVEIEPAIELRGRRRLFCRDPFGNRVELIELVSKES